MVGFIGWRVFRLVIVLLLVTFLAYMLITLLPGDPITAILGLNATAEARQAVRHTLGLDQPLLIRYVTWLGHLVRGDFGTSYISDIPVRESLADKLPVSVELLVLTQLIALAVAVPLGVVAAHRAGGLVDRLVSVLTFGLLSIPAFVVGVVLIILLAVHWHVFPATGYTPLTADPVQNLKTMALPSLTLAHGLLAAYAQLLRADMVTTLREDYITLARARGFSERRILWRHALRPSAISLVTVIGLNMGALIGGSVIIEVLFGLPGIGRLLIDSIFARDYMVVQGGVVLVAVGYVFFNVVVDLVYALVDPRLRHARA